MQRALLALLTLSTLACATVSPKQVAYATAATGAALLLDDEIARVATRNDSAILDRVETFGGGGSDKVIAGFLLYGLAAKDKNARRTAIDAFASQIIAAKAITPAIKQLTNRTRPNGDGDSFPSNHATTAFALASTISVHYPKARWWAYAIATGVAAARVQNNAHWTSDVVAGAAVGTFVGHTVATFGRKRWKWNVSITAAAGGVSVPSPAPFAESRPLSQIAAAP